MILYNVLSEMGDRGCGAAHSLWGEPQINTITQKDFCFCFYIFPNNSYYLIYPSDCIIYRYILMEPFAIITNYCSLLKAHNFTEGSGIFLPYLFESLYIPALDFLRIVWYCLLTQFYRVSLQFFTADFIFTAPVICKHYHLVAHCLFYAKFRAQNRTLQN